MKVPLTYPKISDGSDCTLDKCVVFEKLDGTNLHWVWNDGWSVFGTRRSQFYLNRLGISSFNLEHPGLSHAIDYFNDFLRDRLTAWLTNRYGSCTIFTEFFGPNSFAGQHSEEDAREGKQRLVLIDCMVGSNRMMPPEDFIAEFNQFGIPKVIYRGKYSGQFTEDVRKGKYGVKEGVVCKGISDGKVQMIKIKTDDYLERLKTNFPDNWKEYV